MSEFKSYFSNNKSSEKSFGFVFCFVFAIYAALPLFYGNHVRSWAFVVSFVLLIITLYQPAFFIVPNKIWFKLGIFMGMIVSPIIMGVLFFVSVIPTGLIMRAFGKDLLQLRFNKKTETYWITREDKSASMENQF